LQEVEGGHMTEAEQRTWEGKVPETSTNTSNKKSETVNATVKG